MSTTPESEGAAVPRMGRRGGTLDARARQGTAAVDAVTTQHRIPLAAFARWLHTAAVVLPVPLGSTYAVGYALDDDDLVELTTARLDGSATPGARAGLDPAQERVLDACRPVLENPQMVVFAIRTADGTSRTTAGIVGDRAAVLLEDGPEDVVVRLLAATEVVDAVGRKLPALRGAPLRPLTIPVAALAIVSGEESPSTPAAQRALDAAGVGIGDIGPVWRVQADVRAHGMLGALRPDGTYAGGPVLADWYESPAGSLLKRQLDDTTMQLAPATRESLTAVLAAAVRAATPGRA